MNPFSSITSAFAPFAPASKERSPSSPNENVDEKIAQLKQTQTLLERKYLLLKTASTQLQNAHDQATVKQNLAEIESGETTKAYALDKEKLAAGKAKKITRTIELSHADEPKVYASAIDSSKEKEVRDEVQTAEKIRSNLNKLGMSDSEIDKSSNLALQFESVPKEEWIDSLYTVLMPEAKMDLEAKINQTGFYFPESFQMVCDLVNAMKNLHAAGYVHGDLKPENFLIYKQNERNTAKLSDYGKSRALKAGEIETYSGNPRYCSLEPILTYEGEVFSVALLIIRVLESEFLNDAKEAMLLLPKERKNAPEKKIEAKNRRGIEKFVVLNRHCPQKELEGNFANAAFYVPKAVQASRVGQALSSTNVSKPSSTSSPSKDQAEIHLYIEALVEKLKAKYGGNPVDERKIRTLHDFLRRMTFADPKQRPSMQQVAQELWLPEPKEALDAVHSLLTDETLKATQELKLPKQLLRDFKGARYFFQGRDLQTRAFKELKKEGVFVAKKLGLNAEVRGELEVGVRACQILKRQIGEQALINIGTLCQQASIADVLQQLIKRHEGYVFANDDQSPPEYWINIYENRLNLTSIFYLRSYSDKAETIEQKRLRSIAIMRQIELSRDDLSQNWEENSPPPIAPSLKIEDYYSQLHTQLSAARQELVDFKVAFSQKFVEPSRRITAEDIEEEEKAASELQLQEERKRAEIEKQAKPVEQVGKTKQTRETTGRAKIKKAAPPSWLQQIKASMARLRNRFYSCIQVPYVWLVACLAWIKKKVFGRNT